MAKTVVKLKTKPATGIENCRVVEIGISKMAECLKPGPCTCSYAVPFGYCFLCKHPQLGKIIANTKKARAVAIQ
jgi:hypothetical protein